MVTEPFFSVIIATRNRPDFALHALRSVLDQTFQDFEVILSDNFTTQSCAPILNGIEDARIRYIKPGRDLPMHEHWEFALSHAQGQFVTFLIDKTCLFPHALEEAYTLFQTMPYEVLTWFSDAYLPDDESVSLLKGTYQKYTQPVMEPFYFNPKEILRSKFSFSVPRYEENYSYFLGKICFGLYKRSLIHQIQQEQSVVFFPINPDYTSMTGALAHAGQAVCFGRPLLMQFISKLSNGYLASIDPEYAKRFLMATDPSGDLIRQLPVPGVYASQHNGVAHDYQFMTRFPSLQSMQVNKINLHIRAFEDLNRIAWANESLRQEQYNLFFSSLQRMSFLSRCLFWLSYRLGQFSRNNAVYQKVKYYPKALVYKIKKSMGWLSQNNQDRKLPKPPLHFHSIHEAMAFAEGKYYSRSD